MYSQEKLCCTTHAAVSEHKGVFKGDKKKSQGSEYHLVDKTATRFPGYIRFIASGSELRHVWRKKSTIENETPGYERIQPDCFLPSTLTLDFDSHMSSSDDDDEP